MNLAQIEFFLVLANTLNYTKASQILHTTQPNLSKSIMALEEVVGAQLFIRSRRDVRLTAAGEVFRRETEKVMMAYNTAVMRTREAEEGVHGTINVGFLGTAMGNTLPRIVSSFRAAHPDIFLNLKDYTYSDLMEALGAAEIDVAFIPDKELAHIPDIQRKFIYADDMSLVVSKEHPLAGLSEVDIKQARDEFFVMMDPKISIRDNNLIRAICFEQNFVPQVVYEANTLNNLLIMIGCNIGVSILASHMQRFATDRVAFVKIRGYEKYFKVVAAWRTGKNPSVPMLIEAIDEALGQNV